MQQPPEPSSVSVSTASPSAPRVFVSHSHADNDFCRAFVNGLRAHGLDVWYDEHNLGWGELRQVIERELARCEHFIPILSPAAVASQWVNREIDAALMLLGEGKLKTFLPITAARCDVPLLLRGFKRLEGQHGAPVDDAEAVARALSILGVPPVPRPAPSVAAPQRPAKDATNDPYALPTFDAPWPIRLPPIPPERFPILLTGLGYRAVNPGGVECIMPQVYLIPGGKFSMGSDKLTDRDARDDEAPRHTAAVGTFSIARFPVTVAEYACYVRAGNPQPPHGFAGGDWPTQLQRLDHPVTCVSYNEAAAYAEWLSAVTHQRWRLPTEEEWEMAARWDGQRSRIYPWGDEFDANLCNTAASAFHTTTPVGQYPSGASPCGAEDMAGNVWEWTCGFAVPYRSTPANEPEAATASGQQRLTIRIPTAMAPRGLWGSTGAPPPDERAIGIGRRVVRGGGWSSPPEDARAASRITVPSADYRDGSLGFRLVLAR